MLQTDELTRLYSRKGFVVTGEHLLEGSNGRLSCATLLSIRLSHLKFVAHALGPRLADNMLKRTAAILRDIFHEDSIVGRWNADSLVVLHVASLGRFTDLLKSLNERIDAENAAKSTVSLALDGHCRMLSLPYSMHRESQFNLTKIMRAMRAATEATVCHV
jgi:GGDEF domain-containing protein